MLSLTATYDNGVLLFDKPVKFENPVKVIVTFIDESTDKNIEYKIEVKQKTESNQTGNYNKQQLLLAFELAKQKVVFQNISDSVTWQKKIRDEWE